MIEPKSTLSEIVEQSPAARAACAFHNLEPDSRTVVEAAAELGLCGCELVLALRASAEGRGPWDKSADELIDDILDTHHAYLREALPAGTELLGGSAGALPGAAPLAELARVFADLRAELESHMMKEEQILFPMIRELEKSGQITVGCGHLDGPVAQMEFEHENAKQALRRMKSLRFELADVAGLDEATRERIDKFCQRLHDDLVFHIYKENQVLFPKAQASAATAGA